MRYLEWLLILPVIDVPGLAVARWNKLGKYRLTFRLGIERRANRLKNICTRSAWLDENVSSSFTKKNMVQNMQACVRNKHTPCIKEKADMVQWIGKSHGTEEYYRRISSNRTERTQFTMTKIQWSLHPVNCGVFSRDIHVPVQTRSLTTQHQNWISPWLDISWLFTLFLFAESFLGVY